MVFNFQSQARWIYLDGREHSDPNIYVPSYNGESIGRWEGDTLVVDTRNFETHQHFIDRLVPLSARLPHRRARFAASRAATDCRSNTR